MMFTQKGFAARARRRLAPPSRIVASPAEIRRRARFGDESPPSPWPDPGPVRKRLAAATRKALGR